LTGCALRVARCALAALACAIVGASLLANVALADATPIQLILLYMPNVSNTGTSAASGIAELVMPEGEVRINTADLPRLDDDEQYVAWVVNTSSNDFKRLGAFNTAESSGAVHYENVLPDAIPNKHWNLLLVTVEGSATPDHPSTRHSIAGVFPSADNQPLPGILPNTGGDPDGEPSVVSRESSVGVGCQLAGCFGADWLRTPGLAALTAMLGCGAGYVLGRRRQARSPRLTTHDSRLTTDRS